MALDEKKLSRAVHKKFMESISNASTTNTEFESTEFSEFKEQYLDKKLSLYEKACAFSHKTLNVELKPKKKQELEEHIKWAHLNITPEGSEGFAFILFIGIIFATILLSFLFFGILSNQLEQIPILTLMSVMIGGMAYIASREIPNSVAKKWRMKTSNQMIMGTFYIVTYMRHTSNLENAIKFASDHVDFPLSHDLKKILWDVEMQKFHTIEESIENYLLKWKNTVPEFVDSMHIIISSLHEGDEVRRLGFLEKALSNVLDQTYEKMLHFAHDLSNPLTALNMLGVVLPILTMVILPVVVGLIPEFRWYYLFIVYNVLLFILVYYFGNSLLSKRPSGYSDSKVKVNKDILRTDKVINLGFKKFTITNKQNSLIIFGILFLIGISPIIIYFLTKLDSGATLFDIQFTSWFYDTLGFDFLREKLGEVIKFLDYKTIKRSGVDVTMGPYGTISTILSFFIPLATGVSIGIYYLRKTKKQIAFRKQAKDLEEEFVNSLYQLGNRLGDGLPTEIAIEKVGSALETTKTGLFFKKISANINRLGMDLRDAIFDPKYGAIIEYPSAIIKSSMEVLVEASRKGPNVAAQAMNDVSTYMKQMHKVNERLKDLLGETMSSMSAQIKFLAPVISAVVVGITSMIVSILGQISSETSELGDMQAFFSEGIPTYYIQIVIGLYMVQISFLLSKIVVGLQEGDDEITEKYTVGKNMIYTSIIYTVVAMATVIFFMAMTGGIYG